MAKNRKNRLHRCSCCSNKAVWLYMPGRKGRVLYCDEHVPAGCACRNRDIEDDGEPDTTEGAVAWWPKEEKEFIKVDTERKPNGYFYQYLRDNGKLYPCCEYEYDENGHEFLENITITPTLSIRQVLAKLTNPTETQWDNDNERAEFKSTVLNILQKSEKRHGFTNHNEFMTNVSLFVHKSGKDSFHSIFRRLKEILTPIRQNVFYEDWVANKF